MKQQAQKWMSLLPGKELLHINALATITNRDTPHICQILTGNRGNLTVTFSWVSSFSSVSLFISGQSPHSPALHPRPAFIPTASFSLTTSLPLPQTLPVLALGSMPTSCLCTSSSFFLDYLSTISAEKLLLSF